MFLLGIGFLFLVFHEGERVVGEFPVPHHPGLTFTVYQDQEFDSSTGVYYDLRQGNRVLSEKHILTGTLDYEDAQDYTAHAADSLVYLSYVKPHQVVAIYDLHTKYGFPRSSPSDTMDLFRRGAALLNRLKRHNPRIIGARRLSD
ncbi:hypothetical protein [Hymenobacter elongatus]|uniref:hypothetical protein n=1 Tax=Hymenobacter elongatus TaxID=877208 RepID=UPI001AEC6233|nr:hypothetical protein [Hymenobacter elongatus]